MRSAPFAKRIAALLIYLSFTFFTLFYSTLICAQKKKISLKDSLDGAFDVSDYVIDAKGFVPVPYIITEPALGGIGGAFIPVFIKKRPPYYDSIKGELVKTPVPPDITGGITFYTANDTWGIFGFRSGTFIKSRIKYVIAGGYSDINLSYFRTFDQLGEKEMKFNFRAAPFIVQAIKRLGFSRWYGGFKYLFLKADVRYIGDTILHGLARQFESDKIVSQLGVIVELDNRDNIFTPDKGMKLHVDAICSDDFLGSDFDFWRLNYYTYLYKPLSKKVFTGLRIDGQQAFNDPPFYLLPYISMRGIPAVRYQGNSTLLSELEFRWNVTPRWSAMLFGGTGKAFDEWDEFDEKDWVWSFGTGFRYLLARKFKLRMGIDVAHGPDTWAYYIVFGSSWLK